MGAYELTSMLCLLRIGFLCCGLVNSKFHYIAFEKSFMNNMCVPPMI